MSEIYWVGDFLEVFETIENKSLTYIDVANVSATISKFDFLHSETPFVFMAHRRTTQQFWSYASAVLFAIKENILFSSIYQQAAGKASSVLPWEVSLV